MTAQTVSIKERDDCGSFSAYRALPPASKGPGTVLAQEIFGISAYVRHVADANAQAGFVVIAPEIAHQRSLAALDTLH